MDDPSSAMSKWSSLNVAVVQYPLVGGFSEDQLFEKVQGYVDAASTSGAQLIMIPELFALDMLDFSKPEIPQFERIIREICPSLIKHFRELAKDKNIYLLAGSFPTELPETKKIRNRSYLFSPDGEPVFQDKMFLTSDEIAWGWEAADTVNIIQTPWGTTAINICYDSEFPIVSQALTNHVIDVILVPSMTGKPGFTRVRWAAQARAVEHMAYVLVTGMTGAPAPGWEMTAQGVILGPSLPGFTPTIAEGTKNAADEIVYATLNMTKLREAKSTGLYYPAANQRNTIIEQTITSI